MLSVLRNKPILHTEPYPYFVIEDALPEDVYNQLEKEWPKEQLLSTQPYDNGICYRLKADEMLKPECVSTLWEEFTDYHTSIEFYNQVQSIFADYIKDQNPTLGPRGWVDKSATVWTDCQAVMHEPITTTSRTPHIDNPREIYAGLLYMPYPDDVSTGGEFQIYDTKQEVKQVNITQGRQVLDNDLGKPVTTVPYKRNTFVMFANTTPNAIHGVTPRIDATLHRRSVNIIAEYSRHSNKSMYSVTEVK